MVFHQKPFLGQQINWAHPLARGLVGCWIMNEGSGDKLFDLSGNANHGIFVNDPAWAFDGIDLDGGDDDINCGNKASIRLVDPLSVFAIVNLDALAESDAYDPVVCRYNSAIAKRVWWFGTHDGKGWGVYLSVDGTNHSGVAGTSNVFPSTGEKLMAGLTFDGATCYMYENGKEIHNFIYNNSLHSCDEIFQIGGYNGGNMDGKVYATYAYKRVLTPTEISWLHREPYAMFEQPRLWHIYGAALSGTVTWGHDSGVEEENIRNFTGIWSGTGQITGSGDSEALALDSGEYMESETWNIGSGSVRLRTNLYAAGAGTPIVKHKEGDSEANCEADTWHTYSSEFSCDGWIKVRVEN